MHSIWKHHLNLFLLNPIPPSKRHNMPILQGSEMEHVKPEMTIMAHIKAAFLKNSDIVSFAPHLHREADRTATGGNQVMVDLFR